MLGRELHSTHHMNLDISIIDTFTTERFKGNSVTVVPLDDWFDAEMMQNALVENNLSGTSFIKQIVANAYEVCWLCTMPYTVTD